MAKFFYFLKNFFATLALCLSSNLASAINFEIVLKFQEFFQSDVTLLAVDNEDCNFKYFNISFFSKISF